MKTVIITSQAEMDAYEESEEFTMVEIRSTETIVVNRVFNKSTVVADDNSTVRAYGNSTVRAFDNSKVEAYGNSTVVAYDNSKVEAYSSSTVEADDNSTVRAYGNSTVEAYDISTSAIHAYSDEAKITLDGHSVCWNKCKSKNITKKSDTSVIIDVE